MRREEVKCRFCDGDLPDWKPVLTPAADEVAKALPTMSVTFNGQARRAPPPPLAQALLPGAHNSLCCKSPLHGMLRPASLTSRGAVACKTRLRLTAPLKAAPGRQRSSQVRGWGTVTRTGPSSA